MRSLRILQCHSIILIERWTRTRDDAPVPFNYSCFLYINLVSTSLSLSQASCLPSPRPALPYSPLPFTCAAPSRNAAPFASPWSTPLQSSRPLTTTSVAAGQQQIQILPLGLLCCDSTLNLQQLGAARRPSLHLTRGWPTWPSAWRNAGRKELGGPAMEMLLQRLHDSAHNAEDLLDELDYFRIHDQLHLVKFFIVLLHGVLCWQRLVELIRSGVPAGLLQGLNNQHNC